ERNAADGLDLVVRLHEVVDLDGGRGRRAHVAPTPGVVHTRTSCMRSSSLESETESSRGAHEHQPSGWSRSTNSRTRREARRLLIMRVQLRLRQAPLHDLRFLVVGGCGSALTVGPELDRPPWLLARSWRSGSPRRSRPAVAE